MKQFFLFFLIGLIGAFVYFSTHNQQIALPIIQSLRPKTQFSIEQAPKDSLKATIKELTGMVSWESRTAIAPSILKKDVLIQQGENLLTENDGKVTLQYADQAEVYISPKTAVAIIQTLPANFVFSQASGSAEYKKMGKIPVSVRSYHLIVLIDGDSTVSVDNATGIITVDVKKGTAKVGFNDLDYVSQVKDLKEGEKWEYDDTAREIKQVK